MGLSETKPIILIFGGSQGAKKINEAIINILENKLNNNYQILWATGPKQYDIIKEELKEKNMDIENISNAKIVPYIYNMEEAENIADVVVARAGAMTITEISNLGKASILVPLPNVSNDHQMYNAKVLEKAGSAYILNDNELKGNLLNTNIQKIISNQSLLKQMAKNALMCAKYDVENKIYNEIKKIIK